MNQWGSWRLDGLSDSELQLGLRELLVAGSRTEARIVAHLAEVDARKLHLTLGASSLFDYCLNRLGLSNNEAFHRITAARLARQFPVIFDLLESRAVHLTAVCLLRDHLTFANHAQLLDEVSHKTKTQIEELLARRFPRPDVASRLRKLPSFSETRGPHGTLRGIEPLSGESYRLQVNVNVQLKQKIARARELTSHANSSGDLAVLVERAFDALIERLEAKRFAETKRPRVLRRANTRAAGESHVARESHAARDAETRRHGVSVPGNATAFMAGDAETRGAAESVPDNAETRGAAESVPDNVETRGAAGSVLDNAEVRGKGTPSPSSVGIAGVEGCQPQDCIVRTGVAIAGGCKTPTHRAHLRSQVRREVVARDERRCTFTSDDGQRCTARAFLEFHHETAWALGGADTAQNLKLMCRAHNRLMAERELGAERVLAAIEAKRANNEVKRGR